MKVGGSDEDFGAESAGKKAVRDSSMDESD